jgi:hypothetical protein
VALDTMMRREAKRFALASMANVVAPGPLPRWRHETRREHFQNALSALLAVGSEIAWRPGPSVLFYATRKRAQTELRYALAELREAFGPAQPDWRMQRLLLVGVPAAAAALGVLVRARMSRGEPGEPADE